MMSVVSVSPGIAARRAPPLEVVLAGVAPQHALQHGVDAALHRQVHVLAHRRGLGHRRDDPRR